jgi:hypothetical protein
MSQIREVTASNIDAHWLEWLGRTQSFRYVPSLNAPFTVRKEKSRRGDGDYWYGYRKVGGKLHKRYIGKAEDLTVNRLEEVAAQLFIPTEPRPKPKVPSGSFTQNEEMARVLAENTRLQNELQKSLAEGKNLTVELEAVRFEKDKLQNRLENELQKSLDEKKNLTVELEAVRFEKDKLQNRFKKRLHIKPDYQAVRDHVLNKLKMGRQSTIGKALDALIKELQKEN